MVMLSQHARTVIDSTTSTANRKTMVCTIGKSEARIAPISAAPMPFTLKIVSVTSAPPKTVGRPRAITVTTGISALGSTCTSTTRISDKPRARAART